MIKINLLAEKGQKKAKTSSPSAIQTEGMGSGQNLLLMGLLVVGVLISGGWWWSLKGTTAQLKNDIVVADAELERLSEVRRKRDEYTRQKELLERKIELITNLKKQQAAPVHILDQISKNLPDFLWLESMTSTANAISVSGKATTYNAVSNFYGNLNESGHFLDVTLGRTFEVPEGVSFSLTCRFGGVQSEPAEAEQG
jgi:type IV pilus assembly protein PilN